MIPSLEDTNLKTSFLLRGLSLKNYHKYNTFKHLRRVWKNRLSRVNWLKNQHRNIKNIRRRIKGNARVWDRLFDLTSQSIPNIIIKHTAKDQIVYESSICSARKHSPHMRVFNLSNKSKQLQNKGVWFQIGTITKYYFYLIKEVEKQHDMLNHIHCKIPELVNREALIDSGHLRFFQNNLFQVKRDLYLLPTSEVYFPWIFKNTTLSENMRLYATTRCFRKEGWRHGTHKSHLLRNWEFTKTEFFVICDRTDWLRELRRMIVYIVLLLKRLQIKVRVIRLSDVELGMTSGITYDIEGYSYNQKKWIELSSCSCCVDYQSCRANIKLKNTKNKPYTLNGSWMAYDRVLALMLEYHSELFVE